MGRISVYDTLTAEHTNYNANGKLKDIFPEINFKHSLVLKAGNRIDENYEVQPDDVLYVRKVPGAVTTVAIVAVAVAVVAVGVGVGAAVYANKKSEEARKEMEKAQRNAQNQAQQAQQLPFIRGAKNKNALGNPVQFVMGSVYNTPYNLTNGFYSIDGTDGVNSYYNAVFSAGYGAQKVTDILIGNETLVSDQSGISGEVDFDSQVYEGRVEVRQPGQDMTLTNCNYKVSSTYSGAELKHDYGQDAVPVTVQAASNAYKIQVCIAFSCLRSYDSENEVWTERTAVVRPYWSNDGGQSWNEFTFEGSTNNTFTKNSNKTIRFVATKNFTAQESYGKDILIKVVKETPKAESGTQEDCSLLWYQTFCYDAALSSANTLEPCYVVEDQLKDKITRVAYRIIANDSTENMLDELHILSQGLARTWSNNAWSQTKTPTRNVADWILEVLTTDIHEPSKFDDDEIYLPSFGALHDYCATNEFYCDGIVSESIKKKDLIEKLLTICNSTLIINADGLLEVCIDKEETNPVALLNSENIISMTWSKSLARKLDGKKVTFTNRDSWTVDTFYSMLDGGSYDYATDQVDSLALDYVTTYNHAYKLAQRKLREIQLMPQTMEVDVGSEGDFYPLYSTVLMQLPQLLQGLRSSVIKHVYYNTSNQITKIDISDAVDFVSSSRYGVVIQATNDYGFKLISAEVTGTGQTRTLTFSAPLTPDQSGIVPTFGNHLSFGLLDSNHGFTKVTHTMKIYGIKPNGKSGYVLTLRNYDPDVYSYGGPIPAYKSNVTRPQEGNRGVNVNDITRLRQDMNVLQEDLINAYKLLEMPIAVNADVTSVVVETDELGNVVTAQTVETQITVQQGWEERAFSIGSINVPSGWTYEVVGGKVVFHIAEGAIVRSGQFAIPVIYTPVVAYEQYEDENGNTYVDENDANYMNLESASTQYTYNIWFSYFGLTQGIYLGMISSLANIPNSANLNDYFVWSGTNAESTLSSEGVFKQAKVYKYIGPNKAWKWEPDNDVGHSTFVLPDVLGIAGADLEHNNSYAWEYLDHLTSNSIYADMLVANQAFIELVTAGVINAGSLITVGEVNDKIAAEDLLAQGYASDAQSAAISSAASDATSKANGAKSYADGILADYIAATGITRNYTVIANGKIVTGLIDTETLLAQNLIMSSGGTMKSANFALGLEGWKIMSDGHLYANQALFAKDVEAPLWTAWINDITDVEINLNTESATDIRTKLDALFTRYGKRTFTQNTTDMYIYVNTVSNDASNLLVNYNPLGFEELITHYICRYVENGKQLYVISSVESLGGFNLERKLLEVTNSGSGTVSKFTSSYASNKLLIKTVSDKFEVFGDLYARKYIQGRNGHYIKKRGQYSSTGTAISNKGHVFHLLDVALDKNMEDGITCWISESDDGRTKRYPAMASYKDSYADVVRIYRDIDHYWDYPKDSTDSTSIRFIWI